VRAFEIATSWAPVTDLHGDPRVVENRAVVCFTISGMYLAAVTISDDDDPESDWYTTITDEASERLPCGDHASGRILPRSSERPASRRDHWAVDVRWCGLVRR
jgi:hypothetical protein